MCGDLVYTVTHRALSQNKQDCQSGFPRNI